MINLIMKTILLILPILFSGAVVFGGDNESLECTAGKQNEPGNLIIHCFYETIPVVLTTDYGFLIYRNQYGTPQFVLAQRGLKRIQAFESWDDLLHAIRALPKHSTIHIYDRCTVPPFYSFYPLNEELLAKVKKDFRRAGASVAKTHIMTCTCDDSGRKRRDQTIPQPTTATSEEMKSKSMNE